MTTAMRLRSIFLFTVASVALAGCGVPVEPLMPTPALYTAAEVDPFAHLAPEDRTTIVDMLYATNRDRVDDWQRIQYGNRPTGRIALGAAAMRIGGAEMTWEQLHAASMTADRPEPIRMELTGIYERGGFAIDSPLADPTLESQQFINTINRAVEKATDSDVFIYVHGAKVNFYNACAFTAQLSHFMGRDIVGIAFSWPTRQDFAAYAVGDDVGRSRSSAEALASLIEFLGAQTDARRIHIVCWSAGARVVAGAVEALRQRYPDASAEALRERFRLGTLVFTAADIPARQFAEVAEDAHALAGRLLVTVSDADATLVLASRAMGGGGRLGQYNQALSEEDKKRLRTLDRLEVLDVSYGREERGFNIGGHRYWFNNPWVSADVLLAIRTELDPQQRGLLPEKDYNVVWYLPPDYPERLKAVSASYSFRNWASQQGMPHPDDER